MKNTAHTNHPPRLWGLGDDGNPPTPIKGIKVTLIRQFDGTTRPRHGD